MRLKNRLFKQFKFFIILSFWLLLLAGCNHAHNLNSKTIYINHQPVQVELAETPSQQSRGLSFRQSMPFDHGMLFIFKDYVQPNFWMKDMRFPLDMLWIKDNIIVAITPNIPLPQAGQKLKRYSSPQPINYVLELNAGWAERYHVKIGDKIERL